MYRELSNIGIAINPSTKVALPPKGHIPTPEQITLLEGIGVSIAERGGVKVVGVPVGTDEYARESAMKIVRNGGAQQLAWMLSRIPEKQSANLIATGSVVQRTSYLERVMGPELSLAATIAGCNYRWLHAKKQMATPCGSWRNCSISRGEQKNRRPSRTGARRTC